MGSDRQHLDLRFAPRGKRLCLGLVLGLAASASLAAAGSAEAAKVSEIRVGTHSDHTRVVLELDAPAGYRLSKPRSGDSPELVLTLDASSEAKEVESGSPIVKGVSATPVDRGHCQTRLEVQAS